MERFNNNRTPVVLRSRKLAADSPCLKIPSSPFLKHLGFGTGVDVYLVERSPKHGQYRSPWAIKKINKRCGGDKNTYTKRLKEEAMILQELKHKNIVGFRSFTKSVGGGCILAMEDGEKSLLSMIDERRENGLGPFPARSIMKVACQVADAICYLHHEKHLLHGDLKSANVLIKGDFDLVKLCDFGVTVHIDENLVASNPEEHYVGTESWSPKEVLEGGVVSNKSDIFSYGMTLYEMLTLGIPHMHVFPEEEDYDDHEDFEEEFEAAEDEYQHNLGTRPPLVDYEYDNSYALIIELFWVCSHELPESRPSALQIVTSLCDHHDEQLPVMPDPTGKLEF